MAVEKSYFCKRYLDDNGVPSDRRPVWYDEDSPISGEPHFLLEKSAVWGDGFSIWINALCPSREQFDLTLAEARARIENAGRPIIGARVAACLDPLPMLPISSDEFQTAPGIVKALFEK